MLAFSGKGSKLIRVALSDYVLGDLHRDLETDYGDPSKRREQHACWQIQYSRLID
jgi:hypothetical protein